MRSIFLVQRARIPSRAMEKSYRTGSRASRAPRFRVISSAIAQLGEDLRVSRRYLQIRAVWVSRGRMRWRVEMDGQTLTVIDTAGLRRRSRLADDIEFYSQHRALRSIRRADVVLLMLDATVPVGRVEKRLARYLGELFKPTVIAINKWDLAEGRANREDYGPYITQTLPELAYAPIVLTCATEGLGLPQAVRLAGELFTQARTRVGTGQLNAAVAEIVAHHSPRRGRTTRPGRIYFATQVAVAPPTVVLFVNDVSVFDAAYQRYLLNQLRDRLPFPEVPIRLLLRQRRRQG